MTCRRLEEAIRQSPIVLNLLHLTHLAIVKLTEETIGASGRNLQYLPMQSPDSNRKVFRSPLRRLLQNEISDKFSKF